jgi:hypothetical protein
MLYTFATKSSQTCGKKNPETTLKKGRREYALEDKFSGIFSSSTYAYKLYYFHMIFTKQVLQYSSMNVHNFKCF